MLLIDVGHTVLSAFSDDAQAYAVKQLQRRGVPGYGLKFPSRRWRKMSCRIGRLARTLDDLMTGRWEG
jgi:hypothetical protein